LTLKKNLLAIPVLVLETPRRAQIQNEPGLQIYRV
jgi:hypothetical protein